MKTKLFALVLALSAFSAQTAIAESAVAMDAGTVTAQKRFVTITFEGLEGVEGLESSIPGFVVMQYSEPNGAESMILAPIPLHIPENAAQQAVKVISSRDGRRLAATDNQFVVLQSSSGVSYVTLNVPALLIDAAELEVAKDFDPEAALLVITAEKAVTASAKDLQFMLEYDVEASFAGAVILQNGKFFGVVGYVNNSGAISLDVATYPAIRASMRRYFERLLQRQEEEDRIEKEFMSRQIRI
ncbi:MAG: hypothetical protein Q8Q39_04830 [bacterium]|nr:hypothetical protein [bacterium]